MKGFISKAFVFRVLFMALVCGVALFVGAGELLAQTPPVVEFDPIVDFGSIFDTLTTTLGPIIAGALGLGLAVWGTRYVFGIIKSMGR